MDRILSKLQQMLTDAIRGMTPEQLATHPEGKWSVGDILDHLNLTYLGTAKNLERSLAAGQPVISGAPGRMRWSRVAVVRLGMFPPGRTAPERTLPRQLPPEQVIRELMQNLARMDEAISACDAKFVGRKPVSEHPILGPMTAYEWRRFHFVHGRHHVKQIRSRKQELITTN